MNFAIQKTVSLILLIVIGFLLKSKLSKKDHQQALKVVILNVALPSVIFLALMKLHINPSLLMLPALVIVFNLLFLGILHYVLPLYGVVKNSAEMRTYMLLIPSLAPGLSCFPFITEFLGEDALAKAALADIGNKVAVLFFSYMLAMHWFYRLNSQVKHSNNAKLKSLVIGMLNEPINLVMVGAVALLGAGIYLDDFPVFLQDTINLLGDLMTPLILLFIGVAVVFRWEQFKSIATLLVFRSGIVFCLSALLISFMPNASYGALMLAVVFPQSSCSFWPLAHMTMVEAMGKKAGKAGGKAVFNNELATNVLALSLPFSTLIVLGIFTTGTFFTDRFHLLYVGVGLIVLSSLPSLVAGLVKGGRYRPAVPDTPSREAEAEVHELPEGKAVISPSSR